jgi:hypothetical protein
MNKKSKDRPGYHKETDQQVECVYIFSKKAPVIKQYSE